MLSKEKEIFKNTYSERLDRLEGLTKKINYYDLNLTVESSGNETDFTDLEDTIVFLNNIRGRTICSLLVTFCSLIVTFRLLRFTFCSLLVTFCLLLITFWCIVCYESII